MASTPQIDACMHTCSLPSSLHHVSHTHQQAPLPPSIPPHSPVVYSCKCVCMCICLCVCEVLLPCLRFRSTRLFIYACMCVRMCILRIFAQKYMLKIHAYVCGYLCKAENNPSAQKYTCFCAHTHTHTHTRHIPKQSSYKRPCFLCA
jgi:hypothetical protein